MTLFRSPTTVSTTKDLYHLLITQVFVEVIKFTEKYVLPVTV